jgi:hypothetical protein
MTAVASACLVGDRQQKGSINRFRQSFESSVESVQR